MAEWSLVLNYMCSSRTRRMLIRSVRARWGSQAVAVMSELDRYVAHESASAGRVRRAIVALTDDSIENVRRWVTLASYDFRDVVGPAEYPDAQTTENVAAFNNWKLDADTIRETSCADL